MTNTLVLLPLWFPTFLYSRPLSQNTKTHMTPLPSAICFIYFFWEGKRKKDIYTSVYQGVSTLYYDEHDKIIHKITRLQLMYRAVLHPRLLSSPKVSQTLPPCHPSATPSGVVTHRLVPPVLVNKLHNKAYEKLKKKTMQRHHWITWKLCFPYATYLRGQVRSG